MLRPKLVKNGVSGVGHISGVAVATCLIFGWSCPAISVEPTATPDEQPHLQLAPINLSHFAGGDIGYVFNRTTIGANKTTQQSLGVGVNAGISVSSFIWQPWLATVRSNLTGSVHSTSTQSNTTPTYNSVNTYINGDANLNVLRRSRYPFEARIFRQDGRYAAFYSGTNLDTQLAGYSLSQGYTTMNRRLMANAAFTSQKISGTTMSPDYSDIFSFTLTNQATQHQSITVSGMATTEYVPAQGRNSLLDTLVANHAYQPNSTFSVASVANLFKMSYDQQGSSPAQQYDAHAQQFSSFASLRPERSPLTMTSSVRFIKLDSSKNGTLIPTSTTSNFNLGANYLFSPLIRMYGSVNVADRLGLQTVTTNAALAAAKDYRASTDLGGFLYSGSIGGSLSSTNNTTSNGANQSSQSGQNLGLYLSHALDKATEFGAGHLSKNLNQTVSTVVSSNGSSSSKLDSGGSLSWSRVEGKETTQIRLGARDSRNLGGKQNIFQIINLQASRSEAISHNESLLGNLTVQATHTEIFGVQNSPTTITPNAEINYRNQRAFKVLHLTFESILRIADSNIVPGHQDQATRSWENNFTYKIGRLNLRLTTRMAEIGNMFQSSIMFMMSRPF